MTKKNLSLIGLVIALLGLSVYLNWGRFGSEPLQISDRSVRPRGWMVRMAKNSPSEPVVFVLTKPVKLTSIKVVQVDAYATNKYILPVWQLTTTSNSIPTKDFVYGMNIRGLNPAVKGATADALQPGVKYRLFLEAGNEKLEHDFTPVAK